MAKYGRYRRMFGYPQIVGAGGGGTAYLLDTYPAVNAYSFRQLSSTSTNAIQVRRASDNATQDIGFVGGQLDTASLETFCAGTDGFVSIWYDQGTAGNNFVQATAAQQYKIVSSGTTITYNGKPAMFGNIGGNATTTANQMVQASTFAASTGAVNYQWFAVFAEVTGSNANAIFSSTHTASNYIQVVDEGSGSSAITHNSITVGSQRLNGIQFTNQGTRDANWAKYRTAKYNLLNVHVTNISANVWEQHTLNYNGTNISPIEYWQEYIFYDTDQTANNTAIEGNINTNYELYWDGSSTGILDTYSADAAYSVRALNSGFTSNGINVRRSSDSGELKINYKFNGDIDDTRLISYSEGTDDVFVATWYDQSGNGNDSSQATAGNQPQIVSSGSIVAENSVVCLDWGNGNTRSLQTASSYSWSGSIQSVFSVSKNLNTSTQTIWGFGYSIGIGTARNLTSEPYLRFETTVQDYNSYAETGTQRLQSVLGNSGGTTIDDYDYYRDGVLLTPDSLSGGLLATPATAPIKIGIITTGLTITCFDGTIQEVIIYDSDQHSNRTSIESDINTYFSIYP